MAHGLRPRKSQGHNPIIEIVGQITAPTIVAAAMAAAGCVVIVIAGYPFTAALVAIAAGACAALAIALVRRSDDLSRSRGALRTELVTAVEAWTEMASLGAAHQLARRTLQRIATFEHSRLAQAGTRARSVAAARVISAAAMALAVISASRSGADVATVVFVALLAVGVMVNAERLVAAAEAQVASRQAGERLSSPEPERSLRPSGGSAFQVAYGRDGLKVWQYRLPGAATCEARPIDFTVARGETLTVTGASGTGKTTMLNAIETALRRQAVQPMSGVVVTAVLADDYLFPGTVASSMRLASPRQATTKSAICSPAWGWTAVALRRAPDRPRRTDPIRWRTAPPPHRPRSRHTT